MFGLHRKIRELSLEGKSIKIGLVGLGQMGKGLFSHFMELDGMKVRAICDCNMERIISVLAEMDIKADMICRQDRTIAGSDMNGAVNRFLDSATREIMAGAAGAGATGTGVSGAITPGKGGFMDFKKIIRKINLDSTPGTAGYEEISRCMPEGKIIVSDDLEALFRISDIDVIVDATGNPETGAVIALNAILTRKHIVTLNVEMDVTVGPVLKKLADAAGIVYTLSAGDEPAALKELYDFAVSLRFEVVAAGKGKNNPLDREANPDTLAEYARAKGSSAYMMTSFVDGTKSMIEMACMSNATGLVPDCRGMHGPRCDIKGLLDVFRLKSEGGILDRKGIVDFVIGDLAPGVFLIYTTKNRILREELKYLLFGDGPNYLLYRPYHLTSMETPISIASVYFYGEPAIVPLEGPVSEVITVAKRDIAGGERIDRIGGYKVYGLLEKYGTARGEGLLPVGLAEGAILKKDMEKGRPIACEDVELPGESIVLKLRKLQDILFN